MCIFQGFLTTHRGKALTLFETCENLRNTHWLVGPNHPHNSWKTSARNHFRSGKMVIQWIHSGQMEECFTNLDFPEIFGDFHFSVTFWGRRSGFWSGRGILDAPGCLRGCSGPAPDEFDSDLWNQELRSSSPGTSERSKGIVVVDPKYVSWDWNGYVYIYENHQFKPFMDR